MGEHGLLIGLAIYVAVQLGIGVWVARRIATEDDYLVAGRRLGPLVGAGSVFATWFGAETCIGAAGQIHSDGVTPLTVEPFAYGVCLVVAGVVFAAPLWRRKIMTIADFLHQRFGAGIERFAAILMIPTSLFWAAAQIRAFGHVLSSSSGSIDVETGIAVAAGIAIIYTAIGGLLADVVTDIVQAVAMIVGLVLVVVGVVDAHGGWSAAIDAIEVHAPAPAPPVHWLAVAEAWAIPVCGSVLAQEIVSRTLATRSSGAARAAGIGGGVLYLLIGAMPVFVGLAGAGLVLELDEPEQFLPHVAARVLPGFAAVLFLGALVSAILSTIDSALLVAGSLLSRNVVLAGREISSTWKLRLARLGVVLSGLVAWAVAHASDSVLELIEQASGFGSAGILVAVTFGLFTGWGGRASALGALGGGIVAWIVGAYLVDGYAYPYLTSLACALLGYTVGSQVRDRRAM